MDTRVRYTEDELLREWRAINAPEQLNEENWGYGDSQLEAHLRARLRTWYAKLLRSAPHERLPVADLKEKTTVELNLFAGLEVKLPTGIGRPVEVCCAGWERPVRTFLRPDGRAERWQTNKYLCASPADPLVLDFGDKLVIYGLAEGVKLTEQLKRLVCTAWPADGCYEFDLQDFPKEI